MQKASILLVDDDANVLAALKADMRRAYADKYTILDANGGDKALDILAQLEQRRRPLALIVSDQRMPGMDGVTFLTKAKEIFPGARRLLLTAYADTEVAIRAINNAVLHYYLGKPWEPADQNLFPITNYLLQDYEQEAELHNTNTTLIGYQWSPASHTLKEFLTGNLVPYQWLEFGPDTKAAKLMQKLGKAESDLPVLLLEDGTVMANPSREEVSEKLGLSTAACDRPYDVIVVGGGPAGLAAAVYGASEGLRTLVVEKQAPGGQAGTSSRIENYLGFPDGIAGRDLTRLALTQAKRLGAEFLTPYSVEKVEQKDGFKELTLNDGRVLSTKAVIIATGVEYRKLEAENIDRYAGAGVYYGAANTEAQACQAKPVFVVGGGNSAGQAAMYLSRFASKVVILVRSKEGVTPTMSQYLIDQLAGQPNIEIRPCCVVKKVCGDELMRSIVIDNIDTGKTYEEEASAIFIFIGTRPVTEWIGLNVLTDEKGYILTGEQLTENESFKKSWKRARPPYLLESCAHGLFAAGDVRAGAMNRVASAVGEGSTAIKMVHAYLAE